MPNNCTKNYCTTSDTPWHLPNDSINSTTWNDSKAPTKRRVFIWKRPIINPFFRQPPHRHRRRRRRHKQHRNGRRTTTTNIITTTVITTMLVWISTMMIRRTKSDSKYRRFWMFRPTLHRRNSKTSWNTYKPWCKTHERKTQSPTQPPQRRRLRRRLRLRPRLLTQNESNNPNNNIHKSRSRNDNG